MKRKLKHVHVSWDGIKKHVHVCIRWRYVFSFETDCINYEYAMTLKFLFDCQNALNTDMIY
jgi:hypothetical protein